MKKSYVLFSILSLVASFLVSFIVYNISYTFYLDDAKKNLYSTEQLIRKYLKDDFAKGFSYLDLLVENDSFVHEIEDKTWNIEGSLYLNFFKHLQLEIEELSGDISGVKLKDKFLEIRRNYTLDKVLKLTLSCYDLEKAIAPFLSTNSVKMRLFSVASNTVVDGSAILGDIGLKLQHEEAFLVNIKKSLVQKVIVLFTILNLINICMYKLIKLKLFSKLEDTILDQKIQINILNSAKEKALSELLYADNYVNAVLKLEKEYFSFLRDSENELKKNLLFETLEEGRVVNESVLLNSSLLNLGEIISSKRESKVDKEINFFDLLSDVVNSLKFESEKKEIAIFFNGEDKDRLVQVEFNAFLLFFSFFSNLIHLLPKRSSIKVSLKYTKKSLKILITDSGFGVSYEELVSLQGVSGERCNNSLILSWKNVKRIFVEHNIEYKEEQKYKRGGRVTITIPLISTNEIKDSNVVFLNNAKKY